MGVSLTYNTIQSIELHSLLDIKARSTSVNQSREWWCEWVWVCDHLSEDQKAFGATKLFCMIDDEDVDTFMAYLDVRHILKFLAGVSRDLKIDWEIGIDGGPVGTIIDGEYDSDLQATIDEFLSMFPGDFSSLFEMKGEDILKEWSSR